MLRKRQHRPPAGADERSPAAKRVRLTASSRNYSSDQHWILNVKPAVAFEDILSSLSDELLVRILSYLSTSSLLGIAPVSRRFYRLSADSQLWRTMYYHRFVLPRALRIPGFRDGSARDSTRVHYASRRTVWADGGWGRRGASGEMVDWKRQYKLRHNWARGNATVEELKVSETTFHPFRARKTLVKVIEGIAVTADGVIGLRAWDLKARQPITQIGLNDGNDESTPTCLAIDEQVLDAKSLDVSVGFLDGSFGVWRLYLGDGRFLKMYKHEKSNGQLIGIAYRHPFLLMATESVLISLYSFEGPSQETPSALRRQKETAILEESETEAGSESVTLQESEIELEEKKTPALNAGSSSSKLRGVTSFPAPILITSLKSHTSQAPIALSIRNMASYVIASIAYTYATREGWSIGIQDLQIRRQGAGTLSSSEVVSTRLAFTSPTSTPCSASFVASDDPQDREPTSKQTSDGPKTLCYNHPYLLAAMADNTLILHVCTSNATKLAVSPGIRLWGHTSGISDAEITARGKAVSVSSRGEEIRVWELEGRVSGKSIEIRPNSVPGAAASEVDESWSEIAPDRWDDRRNWVGFDDEMAIVLKETKDGRESLVVYDFS